MKIRNSGKELYAPKPTRMPFKTSYFEKGFTQTELVQILSMGSSNKVCWFAPIRLSINPVVKDSYFQNLNSSTHNTL